jgi:hypothetical protein
MTLEGRHDTILDDPLKNNADADEQVPDTLPPYLLDDPGHLQQAVSQ